MSPTLVRVIVSAGALIALGVRYYRPYFLVSDALTLGLLVVVILPWAGYLFDSAELPGGWKFKFRELEKKTDALQDQAEKSRQRIDSLLIASMSPLALSNLQKLASGNFGSFYRGQGLTWQLLYFASIGYISFKCRGIDEIPVNGEEPVKLNLSDYVDITDFGREYLALRDVLVKR